MIDYDFLSRDAIPAEVAHLVIRLAALNAESAWLLRFCAHDAATDLSRLSTEGAHLAHPESVSAAAHLNSLTPLGRRHEPVPQGMEKALRLVFTHYRDLPFCEATLHRLYAALTERRAEEGAALYRQEDEEVEEVRLLFADARTKRPVHHLTAPAAEVPQLVSEWFAAWQRALPRVGHNVLPLILCALRDYHYIAPYDLGTTGLMVRLCEILLLCRAGYDAVKYVPLGPAIAPSIGKLMAVMQQCLHQPTGAPEGYYPLIRFVLERYADLYMAYVPQLKEYYSAAHSTLPMRIKNILYHRRAALSKAELAVLMPDISHSVLSQHLQRMAAAGLITATGTTRNRRYSDKAWMIH